MKRLMFVTQTHTVWGGMESWADGFGRWMLDRGWDVVAGLARGARYSDPAAYAAAHPHLKPVIMDAAVGTESARVAAVTRSIRRVKPDAVIPIGIGSIFPAVAREKATRLVTPVFSYYPDWIANIVAYLDSIDMVVPNARLLDAYLREVAGDDRVRLVPQGVPAATTRRQPRDPQRLRVAYAGRVEEASKRIFDLARLAELIEERRLSVDLHIYGDGPDLPQLRERIGSRADVHGFLDVETLYRDVYPALDALVLFSPAETGPNVNYEAMQNGVVPVSSRFLGAAAEGLLRNGRNALMFDVGDVAAAAGHLETLAADRQLLERLSAAAVASVAHFTDRDMYAAWQAVIEEVVELPIRPVAPLPRGRSSDGRLARAGLPDGIADAARRLFRRRHPHASGWEEWPGTQPATSAEISPIMRGLARLDAEAARRLSDNL
jgi:glycosyltransferase involved in cell wall biosynthesis